MQQEDPEWRGDPPSVETELNRGNLESLHPAYIAGVASDSRAETAAAGPLPAFRQRRRIWTSLVICIGSLAGFLVASFVMAIVAVIVVKGGLEMKSLANPATMTEVAQSRIGLFILVVLPQCCLVIPALVAAHLSPTVWYRRLSLVRGHWPVWGWIAAALATPLVGLISGILVGTLVSESESLKEMGRIFRTHGTSGFLIPLAFMIGLTPAFCEELLFRGYIQTRLAGSLHPAIGILVASIAFALFHLDPVHILAVFPIGIYLGWLSWRSGSLLPAMLGHFVNNFVSVVVVIFAPEDEGTFDVPVAIVSFAIIFCGTLGAAGTLAAAIIHGSPTNPEDEVKMNLDPELALGPDLTT